MSRILDRLDELYAIGATRIGYSPEEDAAHALVAGWLADAGLAVDTDRARNTFGRRGDEFRMIIKRTNFIDSRSRRADARSGSLDVVHI